MDRPSWTLRWMQQVCDLTEEQSVEYTTLMVNGQQGCSLVREVTSPLRVAHCKHNPEKWPRGRAVRACSSAIQQESTGMLSVHADSFSQPVCWLR